MINQRTYPVLLTIYIDGWCTHCKRFGRLIARMDFSKKIAIKNVREEELPILIHKATSEKAIASIDHKGIVTYGFDTICRIVYYLPARWIFYPLFLLLKVTGLGKWCYRELSVRRKVIPLHCYQEDGCVVQKGL